jgi:hypothetical protein
MKNHKPSCPCVGCRLERGERPNPTPGTGRSSRAFNYLWLTLETDRLITQASLATGKSKAGIVREAVLTWLNAYTSAEAGPSRASRAEASQTEATAAGKLETTSAGELEATEVAAKNSRKKKEDREAFNELDSIFS